MPRLPPGSHVPKLVNVVRYSRDPLAFLPKMRERHGDIFCVKFPIFGDVVYVASPELVKELFTGSPSDLHAGEANATVLEPAVGPSSVLTLDEGDHLRQRKLLLAPFHGRMIERYRDVIRDAALRDLDTWPVGRPFALREHMQSITLDVILRAVYGIEAQDDRDAAHAVIEEFTLRSDALMIPAPLQRPVHPWWRKFVRARAELDAAVYEVIAARRAAGDCEERDDVLSLLMRTNPTDAELRDELVTIVGAGHETTATALAWAIERLVRHPEVLERLRDSLDEGDEYLDAVIKETLRVRPIIVDVARKTTVPFTIGGYDLPAGTLVLAAITALHYREDLYPEPAAFRPERWLEADTPETYTWIPFGGGVRRCLGAAFAQEEMRIVLREIVSRADLRAASQADERVRLRNITLAPRDGAMVVLEQALRPAVESAPAAVPATV